MEFKKIIVQFKSQLSNDYKTEKKNNCKARSGSKPIYNYNSK